MSKVYVCPDGQWDDTTNTCLAPGWIDQPPSFLSGWTTSDVAALVGALLTMWAIWFVIRTVINQAQEL